MFTDYDNGYKSLYQFFTEHKGRKKVSPVYKSAFLQNLEDDGDFLYIACENYDKDSMVTDANYNKICNMVDKYEDELLAFYNKKAVEIIRYSYY